MMDGLGALQGERQGALRCRSHMPRSVLQEAAVVFRMREFIMLLWSLAWWLLVL